MTFRSFQFWATCVVLVLAPFVFGSVDLFWISVWIIVLSVALLGTLATPLTTAQHRILLTFIGLCGLFGLIAVVQILSNPFDRLNDPIWSQARAALNIEAPSRISSRAEIPPLAIGHFLIFTLGWVNGFFVGTSQRSSEAITKVAQYAILAYLAYGLFSLIITPDTLLWVEKSAYRGLLTATFVNHNTAATFAGVGVILWAGSTYYAATSIRFSSLRALLILQSNEEKALRVIRRAAATLVCFFALLATNSRGGLIGTAIGFAVAIFLMGAHRRWRPWQLVATFLAFVAVMGILVMRLGRIASQGAFDDNRWTVYGLVVHAIKDRPLFGAGLGTFTDFFPSLRTTELHGWGIWDFAHSTILEVALEMGIPLALLIVAATVFSVFFLVRAAMHSEGRARRSHAAIAGIACLTYVHSAVDFSLQIPGYSVVFAILLGQGLARASAQNYSNGDKYGAREIVGE